MAPVRPLDEAPPEGLHTASFSHGTDLPKRKVAIIGTGLAGLTAAFLLSPPNGPYDVTVLEAAPTFGMDAHGIDIPCGCQRCGGKGDPQSHVQQRIDTPLRAFTEGNYPTLVSLYRHLGIRMVPSNFSVSFSSLSNDLECVQDTPLISDRMVTVGPWTIRVPTWLWRPWKQTHTPRMVLERARMGRIARHLRTTGTIGTATQGLTLGEWLQQHHFHSVYVHGLLLPLLSGMLSAPHQQVLALPAAAVLHWSSNPRLRNRVMTVPTGVQEVCHRLLHAVPVTRRWFGYRVTRLEQIHSKEMGKQLRVVAEAVDSGKQEPTFSPLPNNPHGRETERNASPMARPRVFDKVFDVVIMATPPPVSAELVRSSGIPDDHCTANLLQQFRYEEVPVVVHTDPDVLPRHDGIRAVNFTSTPLLRHPSSNLPREMEKEGARETTDPLHDEKTELKAAAALGDTMATVVVNELHHLPDHCPLLLQTTNPLVPIRKGAIRHMWTFPRARLTLASERALTDVYARAQGLGQVYYVGSALYPGIPLLEGCVASALDVAGRLGIHHRPWPKQPGEYVGYDEAHAHRMVEAYYAGELAYVASSTSNLEGEGDRTGHPPRLQADSASLATATSLSSLFWKWGGMSSPASRKHRSDMPTFPPTTRLATSVTGVACIAYGLARWVFGW